MLAGTVTNRTVYTHREASYLKDPQAIGKCPFALARRDFDPKDVILMIRDPADIVSSTSHGDYPGEYMFGWVEDESAAKKALKANWDAMKPYIAPKLGRGAFVVRYEDLISRPNDIQKALGQEFGLEYNGKEWSNWPDGFKVEDYWLKPLGQPRKLKARKLDVWAQKRVGLIKAKHEDYRECCRVLGYEH